MGSDPQSHLEAQNFLEVDGRLIREGDWRELTSRCEALTAEFPNIRVRLTHVLGTGLPANSIVLAETQWSKGYCAGVKAALMAFDDAVRLALATDRMKALGITEQDIAETMPPKWPVER